jgi:hypothetical protein
VTPPRRPGIAALACFAAGAALLLLAEPDLLRLAGSLLLLLAVFLGATAVATPELLERDEDG